MVPEDNGMGSQYDVPYVNALVIIAFLGISWYNVAELTVLIQTFFKRRAGFYYWSLMISTWCIFLHGLGMFFKFWRITEGVSGSNYLNTTISGVGWVGMVTGQSIVLYSRLYLIMQAAWTRWVLIMIITNAIVLHIPTLTLTYLTNASSDPARWTGPYSIMERIQVTFFFIQETILSGIYIWKTTTMLRAEGPLFKSYKNVRGGKGRKVLIHTIGVNFVIIALDLTLIGLEYAGIYDIQTAYKSAVYSIKLKMEFTILNQLMNLVMGRLSDNASFSPAADSKSQKPHNTNIITRSAIRSGIKTSSPSKGMGNSAGAYARMDESTQGNGGISLQDLKRNDVLRTTITEVKSERMEVVAEGVESLESRDGKEVRRSVSSSEVHIMDYDRV